MMRKRFNKNGSKDIQRDDTEYRAKEYLAWHRTLSPKLLALDTDLIEWRFKNGKLVAVGVFEITRSDVPVTENYLKGIINRYEERDIQAKVARKIAEALNTKAWIVLFTKGCKSFWVYNLTDKRGWWDLDEVSMEKFLETL